MTPAIASADVTVTVRSTIDRSRSTSAAESKQLEALMRRTIDQIVARAPVVLPGNRNVDACLERLTTDRVGNMLVVTARIRVVITDDDDRITSVLGMSAKVEASARKYRLPRLREEAVASALESGYRKIKDRLHGMQN
jgi:hypothetical protein